ncbi:MULTISPECIES: helix-turn-helix domain-containing protein [Enterobacteriaceae]|uniref:helix-turn-helix domain-containing protein n=1 Tax=Enterobacteriaceae TaxID=543 RepID=UPI00034EFF25|nr:MULTISPECIES: transcriptional regulator [Enterobacteriaceae]AGN83693.1 repressor [Enterobacter sp. R4-368]QHM96983.1 transcriptional regulator [Kosakonia sacchari]RCW95891.1 hypothetical protein DFO56_11361 [Kosakonia sp. AG348]
MVSNETQSTAIGQKIRAIRDAEGLSRTQFFELTGIPSGTQKHYEMGRREGVGSEILLKITQHPRFAKYTLWLMTDTTIPEAGQIEPVLSPDGQSREISHRSGRKTG